MKYQRLGDLLVNTGLISQEQLDTALLRQKESKKRLGQQLIDDAFITEQGLIDALRIQLGIEFIDLSATPPEPLMAEVLPQSIAKTHGVVPVRMHADTLYLAMRDPMNFVALEEVKSSTRKRVVPMISTADGIDRAIAGLYGNEGANRAIEDMKREMIHAPQPTASEFQSTVLDAGGAAAPTVRLVNSIIERAVAENASDIHVEPFDKDLRVRMRIDGVLRSIMTVPKDLQGSLLSRLKVMGGMDITERRIPQDGRSAIRVKNRELDLRMSTLPTIYGEKFVIRLLDKDDELLKKENLGLSPEDIKKYRYLLSQHNGVILMVGPTGSGKSSTMYTMIRELNTEQVNLVTLEDPVEYNVGGVNQVQINEKVGMTFADGLRSILRQDPDVVAVGEIRDGETAEIAMRAAITGHLVLSTVHTNDALATIDRLLDIGVEGYLIADALNGVISQRLVRRVCPHCRKPYIPSAEELTSIDLPADSSYTFYKGEGCPACFGTGYRGRTGIFEILVLTSRLRSAITRGARREELQEILEQDGGMTTLSESCRALVLNGTTTVEEARRVTLSADYLL